MSIGTALAGYRDMPSIIAYLPAKQITVAKGQRMASRGHKPALNNPRLADS